MKLKNLAVAVLFIVVSSGCAMQRPLFKMPLVSATNDSIDSRKPAENLGAVSAQFCPGDQPAVADNKNIGLLDEVIFKAQHEKNASYIKDAQFYTVGQCVMLQGDAFKLKETL